MGFSEGAPGKGTMENADKAQSLEEYRVEQLREKNAQLMAANDQLRGAEIAVVDHIEKAVSGLQTTVAQEKAMLQSGSAAFSEIQAKMATDKQVHAANQKAIDNSVKKLQAFLSVGAQHPSALEGDFELGKEQQKMSNAIESASGGPSSNNNGGDVRMKGVMRSGGESWQTVPAEMFAQRLGVDKPPEEIGTLSSYKEITAAKDVAKQRVGMLQTTQEKLTNGLEQQQATLLTAKGVPGAMDAFAGQEETPPMHSGSVVGAGDNGPWRAQLTTPNDVADFLKNDNNEGEPQLRKFIQDTREQLKSSEKFGDKTEGYAERVRLIDEAEKILFPSEPSFPAPAQPTQDANGPTKIEALQAGIKSTRDLHDTQQKLAVLQDSLNQSAIETNKRIEQLVSGATMRSGLPLTGDEQNDNERVARLRLHNASSEGVKRDIERTKEQHLDIDLKVEENAMNMDTNAILGERDLLWETGRQSKLLLAAKEAQNAAEADIVRLTEELETKKKAATAAETKHGRDLAEKDAQISALKTEIVKLVNAFEGIDAEVEDLQTLSGSTADEKVQELIGKAVTSVSTLQENLKKANKLQNELEDQLNDQMVLIKQRTLPKMEGIKKVLDKSTNAEGRKAMMKLKQEFETEWNSLIID